MLRSTKAKTWFSYINSNNLNPICRRFSLGINIDLIIILNFRSKAKVIELSFLSIIFFHNFWKGQSFSLFPFLRFIRKKFSLRMICSHFNNKIFNYKMYLFFKNLKNSFYNSTNKKNIIYCIFNHSYLSIIFIENLMKYIIIRKT